MARKNGIKSENSGSIHFDTRTKAVMAEVSGSQDNVKEKVASVREVVAGRSTNEIILVLQFYDYDVARAIQAYVEDGAKEALTQWHFSGKQVNSKKKKNRKKKQTTESVPASSQNGDLNGKTIPNGSIDQEGSDISKLTESDSEMSPVAKAESPVSIATSDLPLGIPELRVHVDNHLETQVISNVMKTESQTSSSDNLLDTQQNHTEHSPTPQPQRQPHQPHHNHRHRTDSGSHSHGRQRTTSERSTSSVTNSESKPHFKLHAGKYASDRSTAAATKSERKPNFKLHAGLERSVKDLHRQTVSLERLRLILNEEVDKAYKRIKTVFDEMRTCVNNREVDLIQEMDKVKLAASDTFAQRQKQARELKVKVDRSESMNEQELAELRADIKHFVSDRKIDEDLGRTTRFMYDSDHLSAEIKQFGEVVPVKCMYSQRRPSVSSVASNDSLPMSLPSPVTDTVPKQVSHSEQHESLNANQAHEVAELQKRLKGSLQLQGYPVKSATFTSNRPNTSQLDTSSRPNTAPVNRPQGSSSNREDDNRRNRRGAPRGGGRGSGYRPTSSEQNFNRGLSGSSRGQRSQYGRGGSGRGRGNYQQNQNYGRPRSPRKDGPREYRGGPREDVNVNSSPGVSASANS